MTGATSGWENSYRLEGFLERLEEREAITARSAVEQTGIDIGIEPEGVVYHDRGLRAPGYDATFVRETNRETPAFSVELDTIGPRSTWAVFDASKTWDVYLLTAEDVAALAWVTDEEFAFEETGQFGSKGTAVDAGRFSFGVFLHEATEWNSQVDQLEATDSPAFLYHDDGTTYYPQSQDELYRYVDSSPEEFRDGGNAPSYLGLLELEVSID